MAHAGGRPLKFTVEELQTAVDLYFATEDRQTLAGLALALDVDRHTIYNYAEKDEFFHIIKKARERVEAKYESRLIYDNNPTGVIFALKNMGWRDKTEQELYGKDGEALTQPLNDSQVDKIILALREMKSNETH